ncbi:unnamed protein product [Sphagnum jensenii]
MVGVEDRNQDVAEEAPRPSSVPNAAAPVPAPSAEDGGVIFVLEKASLEAAKVGKVLYRRQKTTSGGLKIKDVNNYLDRLAAAEDSKEKIAKLAELINKTNVQEMRWIIMIILKELKLGISEKTVFSVFHPDAEDLFNDIEVGKAVRPQLASRVGSVEEAWKKLRGKEVVVECKFDGDRIQVHKNGNDIHFFSSGDSSVIHQPLRERHQLLQKSVHPIKGHLELLLPESGGLNENRPPGEPQWSILASSAEEVQKFFQETVDNRDEGVILKDLDSKWEPSDRSTKWLKLKPDYIHSESDLDVLIIG